MNSMKNQIEHWSNMSEHGALAAVIDPRDKKGFKNSYISDIRTRAIRQHLPQAAVTLLDFGCGSGNLSRAIASPTCHVIGVDITWKLLQLAPQGNNPSQSLFLYYDGLKLPLQSERFDLVTTYLVLIHITEDERLKLNLNDIHRILKKGGQLFFIEQTCRNTRLINEGLKKQRSVEDLSRIFKECGFTVTQTEHLRSSRFPILYLIAAGLVPKRFFSAIARLDKYFANLFNRPRVNYVDTLFRHV